MSQESRDISLRKYFLVSSFFLFVAVTARGQDRRQAKRSISVADSIGMTTLATAPFGNDRNQIAHYSPNGQRFVLIVEKGNLEHNTHDCSVLLYRAADVIRAPKPEVLLKMSSSSNRAALSQLRWLADNDTLVFLAENPGDISQVYSFNIGTKILKKLTNQATPILTYDITPDGRALAFIAEPAQSKIVDADKEPSREIVIQGQHLDRILAGDYSLPEGQKVFWQVVGSAVHPVQVDKGYFPGMDSISISPSGRYVVFPIGLGSARFRPEWAGYRDEYLHQILTATTIKNADSGLQQYLIFDSQNMSSVPLIDAPIFGGSAISWGKDSESVFLSSYLPLDVADPAERNIRAQNQVPVEVKLPSRTYQKVKEVPAKPVEVLPVQVALEQDLNTPPKVFVIDSNTHQKALLLDLNPQFSELEFGSVKELEWDVNGATIIAGLYLPPDYQPGKRYPLVIQTHGFEPKEFSMSGIETWSSAYAARSLAARGILVLQTEKFKNYQQDHDRISNDRNLGATGQQSFKNFSALVYTEAIDLLDKKGMIDRSRVGIVGFSRTVCFVAYTLTHSKFRFAAASLVDGIGCGYFDEMVFPNISWDVDALNGGFPPFGEGLKVWMKNSPGFNLDKIHTPVRLVALDGRAAVMGDLWQWYAGLSLLKKPVDFVFIPGATHLVVKPRERLIAQQGLVDWFCFWLKGEEDPGPSEAEQYKRWGELRKLQEASRSDANTSSSSIN
jgi:dipeptidyl aminopeptidase/acylaminoacyl peptidase